MSAKVRIQLYDDHGCFCGEYNSVEEIFGWLRCARRVNGQKLYDLYSLDAEIKFIEGAVKIYWAPDGHTVAVYADGTKNEIWKDNSAEMEAAV